MLSYIADALTALAVVSGLISSGCWWWSARLQAGRIIGTNPGLIGLDRKVMKVNGWAATLIGLSIAAQAGATVLGRLETLR